MANDSYPERLYMFYFQIATDLGGMATHWMVLLFFSRRLIVRYYRKMIRNTRWYKTVRHIRVAIAIGVLLVFINVLEDVLT